MTTAVAVDVYSLLVFGVLFLLGYLLLRKQQGANLPPGPWSVPVLGSLPFLKDRDIRKESLRLSKVYNSDVITIKLGPHVGVFLNTFESIKAAMVSEDFVDRPHHIFFLVTNGLGIGSSNGSLWKEHRRLSLSLLRDFGMGKMAAEDKVLEEIRQLILQIRNHGREKFDVGVLLNIATANVIFATIVGQRYDYDDFDFLHCVTRIKENFAMLGSDSMLGMYPSLRHIPGNLFNFGTIWRNATYVWDFIGKQILKHKKRFDRNNIADFLDAYLAEKETQDARNPDNTFTDKQILNVLTDLLLAGSETSATTIKWAILYMISFPEIQRKIQSEIDEILGKDRLPTMHDRQKLPFCEATVSETYRVSSLAGLGLPHSNMNHDVIFKSFKIPKGAMIMPNIWAVHRDPEFWKYPDVFDPRNFLDDQGALLYNQALIPFGIGRRQCPGESLARMEVFLMFVGLFQTFTFSLPDGAPTPKLDGIFTASNAPPPFEVCVAPRLGNHL